jgi:hypothetical protein
LGFHRKAPALTDGAKLERLLRQKWHHETVIVESDGFSQQLAKRIASGEITIAFAAAPAVAAGLTTIEDKEVSVLRYQRWADDTKTTDYDIYQQLEFFRVDKNDLLTANPIGSASDAFVFKGKLYFDSISERGFDDRWQSLPIPQPELFIYTVQRYDSNNTALRTACHLLYVQKAQK